MTAWKGDYRFARGFITTVMDVGVGKFDGKQHFIIAEKELRVGFR